MKNVLIGICGSISFYKAFELISMLKKEGYNIKIILSNGAMKFINPLAFEVLSENPVLCENSENWLNKISHLEYSKTDIALLYPASVNTINKLANGICDNVFMQCLIALKAPLIIAPAANERMLSNESTKKSINFLKKQGVDFLDPVNKILACKEEGRGGLVEPINAFWAIKKNLTKNKFKDKKVLITGGSSYEDIDNVRVISNHSSGKMAKALADAMFFNGADVKLLASFEVGASPYEIIKFKTAKELFEICQKLEFDYIIMVAAISDYKPVNKFNGKLKKSDLGTKWNLNLEQNLDVLQNLNGNFKKIGFKLEVDYDNGLKNAKEMLINKNLDAVCLNILGEKNNFGSEYNEIFFITKNNVINLEMAKKDIIANQISDLVSKI